MANDQKEKPSPVLEDMWRIGIHMGLLVNGEDYLMDCNAPPAAINLYLENKARALAKATAKRLGLEDETALLHAKDRTPEQSAMMLQISAEGYARRFQMYMESNFFASLGLCLDAMAEALEVDRNADSFSKNDDAMSACSLINTYFYAQHKDIKPEAPAALDDESKAEIRALVAGLVAYQKAHGGTLEDDVQYCFNLAAPDPEKLTEISRSSYFSVPTSKAWQREPDIALEGNEGQPITVSPRNAAESVVIKAQISDMDGKPLNISAIQKGVQRAIGNLIDEAGGKPALPITVSPAQIYRAYARLPFDAPVTAQQEAEMEAAMKTLMFAPSSIDFEAQLKKHKHIERQKDYDYDGKAAGKLEGNLVQAQKLEGTAKNGARVVAYKIYDYPVFYMYSHVVAQMAYLRNELLTGSTKPATKPAKAEAQQGAQYVAVKENILTRILNMKREREQKNRRACPKKIRTAEVAEDCGITLTRQRERTLLKNIEQYLKDLQAQGEIKGYNEAKEGRKVAGFSILL